VTRKLDELSIRKISLKIVNQAETNGAGKLHKHKKAKGKTEGNLGKNLRHEFSKGFA
jgi:hypothetical protein